MTGVKIAKNVLFAVQLVLIFTRGMVVLARYATRRETKVMIGLRTVRLAPFVARHERLPISGIQGEVAVNVGPAHSKGTMTIVKTAGGVRGVG